MKNRFFRFPFFIIVLVTTAVLVFAFFSNRLTTQISTINDKAEHTNQVLFQILTVQKAIMDKDNLISQFLIDPTPSLDTSLVIQEELIKKEIAKLRLLSVNEAIELSSIDTLSFYVERKFEISRKLIAIRTEKGLDEAIYFKIQTSLDNLKSRILLIINRLEALENQEFQSYLATKEKTIGRLNVNLFAIFLFLIFLVIINLIQFNKSYNQKKKELEYTKYIDKILSNISDSVITTDADFKVRTWNKAAEKLYGFDPIKVKSKDIAEAVRSMMGTDEINQIRKEMRTKGYWNGEAKHLNAEGMEIVVQSYRSAIRDENGNITGYVSSNRDITQKKLADQLLIRFNQELAEKVKEKTKEIKENKERLEVSEKNLRQVLSSSADIFYAIDKDYNIILINSIAEKQLSVSWKKPVTLGANLLEIIPSESDEQIIKNFKKVFAGERIEYELQIKEKNLPEWVFVSYSPVTDENGNITGAYVVTKDITERKKAELLLKDSEEKYRVLVEQSLTGIYIIKDEKFIYVNPRFAEIFGYEPEEMLELNNAGKIVYEPDKEMVRNTVLERLDGKAVSSNYYFRGIKKDGSILNIEVFGSVTMQSGQPVTIGSVLDKTSQYTAAEEVRKANARFELLNKASNNAVWEWNLETNEVWGNEVHQAYYGLLKTDPGPDDKEWMKRIAPADRENMKNINEKLLASNKNVFQSEYKFYTENKGWINVFANTYIDRNKDGKAIRMIGTMLDITDRIKAEELIRSEEEVRRLIMDSSMDAIICIDKPGKITFWNPQAEKVFGWKENEIFGKTLTETIIPEQYRELHKKGYKLYLDTGVGPMLRKPFEITALKKDGEEFPVELNIMPVKQGETEFFCAFIRDISVRKKAENELRLTKESYFALMNNVDGIVWEADAKTFDFSFVSKQAERLLGYPVEQWLNEPGFWPNHIHEEDRSWAVDYCMQCTLEKKAHEFEYRMLAADGRIVWLRDIVTVQIENNQPVKLTGLMVDITEAKKAEKVIRQSEEKYRSLIQQASEPIIIYSFDGTIHEFNGTACDVSGYSNEEFKNLSLNDLIVGEIVINAENADALMQGRIVTIYRQIKKKDGTILDFEFVARLLEENKILAFGRDITERKRIAELVLKEKELSESIISNLPDIFYLFNKDGKFLRWNKNFEKVLGYNKKEIAGITPFDLFESSLKEPMMNKLKEIIETGKIEFEGNLLNKTRKKIPYFFKGWKVHYEGNSCIIGIGVDMTNKIKSEELLQKSFNDIRRLASHLEEVREEERIAIAREIHDELGQQLTVLKMDISWLDSKLTDKEDLVQKKIDDLLATIDSTITSVRRISSELRPSILDDLGLITALEWHAQEFEKRSGVKTKFKSELADVELPVNKSTGIYRIFQESLTNIARHAKASLVSILIKLRNNELIMTIQDDGNGFDSSTIGIKKTLGILGMRERANIMGGIYFIESKPGKGTVTKLKIPVNKET